MVKKGLKNSERLAICAWRGGEWVKVKDYKMEENNGEEEESKEDSDEE